MRRFVFFAATLSSLDSHVEPQVRRRRERSKGSVGSSPARRRARRRPVHRQRRHRERPGRGLRRELGLARTQTRAEGDVEEGDGGFGARDAQNVGAGEPRMYGRSVVVLPIPPVRVVYICVAGRVGVRTRHLGVPWGTAAPFAFYPRSRPGPDDARAQLHAPDALPVLLRKHFRTRHHEPPGEIHERHHPVRVTDGE